MSKFDLEFAITRRFPWPYFTPIVLSVSAMWLVVLTVLNVRLAGFETVTSLKEDFNFTQSSWLDRINPNSQGQSLCQPVILKMGDSFVTNSSIFLWDLELVTMANHSSSGLIYKGSTLRGCDIIALYLNGRPDPPTLDFVAVISCEDLDGFDIVAKTAFPISVLPGTYTRFALKLSRFSSLGQILPYNLIQLGAADLLSHVEAMNPDKSLPPGALSAEVSYTPCPATLGTKAPCATDPPPIHITSSLVTISNGTSTYPIFDTSAFVRIGIYRPLANIIQTIHAAVQIDLGIPHENNFLLNPSALNKTLYSEFPARGLPNPTFSALYQVISTGNFYAIPDLLPLKVAGPAKLEARYLCHLQQMKPPAQAFIAVLVATLSMFISGWGMFMLLATYWAKRGDDSANSCVSHDIEVGARLPLLPVTR